jgi:hypothetical protein
METRMPRRSKNTKPPEEKGVARITIAGFKSVSQEQSIEVRPLTLLAGAHSAGKSSIMQPLLLDAAEPRRPKRSHAPDQANFITGETLYVSGGPKTGSRED